jgi:hypothetical protein
MLFFFELFLFVLVMLTLALGEFVSRGLALGLWLVATVFAIIGYVLARGSLASLAARESGDATAPTEPPGHAQAGTGDAPTSSESGPVEGPTPLDERWARTLLYNWRRANVLLLLGVLAVGLWYWLGA